MNVWILWLENPSIYIAFLVSMEISVLAGTVDSLLELLNSCLLWMTMIISSLVYFRNATM